MYEVNISVVNQPSKLIKKKVLNAFQSLYKKKNILNQIQCKCGLIT